MSQSDNIPQSGESIILDDQRQVTEAVNNLTRLRQTKRAEFRVTIFGSARISREHWVYGAVRDLTAELGRMGCGVVTGGGAGLMEAANEGAALVGPDAQSRNIGIRLHLPCEQEVNPFVGQCYEHGTFFSRLHHFVLVSEAFIVMPGGIGTVLELATIWKLLQVRKSDRTPLILIGRMWAEFIKWGHECLLRPDIEFANPEDLKILQCVDTTDQAIAIIHRRHEQWQRERGSQTR